MNESDERFARTLHHASKSTEIGHAFSPPIVNTSVYRLAPDPSGPYQYARWANPTWTALEEALAILEDAETVTFPSGMAAIAAVAVQHSEIRRPHACCRRTATTRCACSPKSICCRWES